MDLATSPCLCWRRSLILIAVIVMANTQSLDDNSIVLFLQSDDRHLDLDDYRCKVPKSQTRHSTFVTQLIAEEIDQHGDHDIEVPLSYDVRKQFWENGFNSMCNYLQTVTFYQDYDQHYQLPTPLLLSNSNEFYNGVKDQLTNQEIEFMKEVESFDDNYSYDNNHNNNNNNNNVFDIFMTRMDSLFRIAEYLQMERLFTIIAARQASLMIGMNKQQMIDWLMDGPNTKTPMIFDNDNNECNNDRKDNNHNEIMIPLLSQTHSSNTNRKCTKKENDSIVNINQITKYNWARLKEMLPFFSCSAIHTFASISKKFEEFVNEWWNTSTIANIDSMIKVLTSNSESTCLSLTNQEALFYKPFLMLRQDQWSDNQTYTYSKLQRLTNVRLSFPGESISSTGFPLPWTMRMFMLL